MKTTAVGGEERSYDGCKQVKGRKRYLLVDTMGDVLKVLCHAANLSDVKGAMQLLAALPATLWDLLQRLWADGSYRALFCLVGPLSPFKQRR